MPHSANRPKDELQNRRPRGGPCSPYYLCGFGGCWFGWCEGNQPNLPNTRLDSTCTAQTRAPDREKQSNEVPRNVKHVTTRKSAEVLVFLTRNGVTIGTQQVSCMRAESHQHLIGGRHGPQRLENPSPLSVEHAKRQLQRPTLLVRCHTSFADAKDHNNAFASWDHLPPTSPATTTSRAGTTLGFSPSSHPELDRRWHQPCGECRLWCQWPINWHPPNKVSPSTTTSRRCKSLLCGGATSKSLTITFVDTLAPPSRNI